MTRVRTRALVVGVVVVVLVAGAQLLGCRLNLRTERVGVPPATATPTEVALAYMDAFNHRDRQTMEAIFPSRHVARFRPTDRWLIADQGVG